MYKATVTLDIDEIYNNLIDHDKERFIESHLSDVPAEDLLDSIEDIEVLLKYVESYDYKIVRPSYEQSPEDKLMNAIFGNKKNKLITLDLFKAIAPVKERMNQLHLEGDKLRYYRAGMINTIDAITVALKELNIPGLIVVNRWAAKEDEQQLPSSAPEQTAAEEK